MFAMRYLEPVVALTSAPAYLTMLFGSLSGPGEPYISHAIPRNQFLHSPMTLGTRGYCFLSLREVVS